MIVEIDGNDGVGKTFIIEKLSSLFKKEDNIVFRDRGSLTKATDNNSFFREDGVCYILLDCDENISQERIKERGDSIEEKYHTLVDLKFYRERFLALANDNNIPIFRTDIDRGVITKIYLYIIGYRDGYNSRNK